MLLRRDTSAWRVTDRRHVTWRVRGPGVGIAMVPSNYPRTVVDHLFDSSGWIWNVLATGVLVETLLDRGADGDVAEAEAAIDRLGGGASRPRTGAARNCAAAPTGTAGAGARRRGRLPRLSGSLPRDGDIAWLRGAYGVGRGDAMTAAAPSGVVTFLFTDVEGSTRRWEADADGMRVALAAHDEVLRKAIEAHDGFLFSHTGDGVCGVRVAEVRGRRCGRRAAGTGVAGADGHGDRRGRTAGRGLLRHGAQPRCAGDGRRAWRSDSGGRLDGSAAHRGRSSRSGAATVAGCADAGRGVPGPSTGTAGGISAVAGIGYQSWESAACGQQLHRARVRGRRGASGGAMLIGL